MDGFFDRMLSSASSCTFSCALTLALATSLLAATLPAHASIDEAEDEMLGYDAIVNQLNRENRESQAPAVSRARAARVAASTNDPFEDVLIHGGVGFANTIQTVDFANGDRIFINQKGFQATLGIDLFSENWMAEGAARSFGGSDESTSHVSLKEFDLKILFRNKLANQIGIRAGGGLTARYMTIQKGAGLPIETTTPSSVATVGFDMYLSKGFSLGLDISARNTMIAETIDRNSYDATFRMDTHF